MFVNQTYVGTESYSDLSGFIESMKVRGENKEVLFTAHHSLLLSNNQRVALVSLGHLQGPLCHLGWGHETHIDKAT